MVSPVTSMCTDYFSFSWPVSVCGGHYCGHSNIHLKRYLYGSLGKSFQTFMITLLLWGSNLRIPKVFCGSWPLPFWGCLFYRVAHLTAPPLKVLSVRLNSKSHHKSPKCQNFLTGWYLEFFGGHQFWYFNFFPYLWILGGHQLNKTEICPMMR